MDIDGRLIKFAICNLIYFIIQFQTVFTKKMYNIKNIKLTCDTKRFTLRFNYV